MWPLLKRDGLGLQYLTLTLGWNYLIGYNPFHLRHSFVKYLSLVSPAFGALSVVVDVPSSRAPTLSSLLSTASNSLPPPRRTYPTSSSSSMSLFRLWFSGLASCGQASEVCKRVGV